MRGRPPKPTNLRVLEGNPGTRPLDVNEPKPRIRKRAPAPPKTWATKENGNGDGSRRSSLSWAY